MVRIRPCSLVSQRIEPDEFVGARANTINGGPHKVRIELADCKIFDRLKDSVHLVFRNHFLKQEDCAHATKNASECRKLRRPWVLRVVHDPGPFELGDFARRLPDAMRDEGDAGGKVATRSAVHSWLPDGLRDGDLL